MKVIRVLLGVVAASALLLVVAVSTRPDSLHVERSLVVQAAPADVFPYLSDLDRWVGWNPWTEMDPDAVLTFGDSRVGEGAWYEWKGEKSGQGRMTLTAVQPDAQVDSRLDFMAPMQATATVRFTLTPEGEGTQVVWTFDEALGFSSKAMGLVMDMDQMLGGQFEQGLATLAPLVEADAARRVEAERQAAAEAAAAEAAALAEAPPATDAAAQ